MSSYYDEPDDRPVCVECGDRLREGTHVASGGIVHDVEYACEGCGVRWRLIRESVELGGGAP